MGGGTIPHYQISDKLGEDRRGRHVSRPRRGFLQQVAIRDLKYPIVPDTQQLARIKRHARLRLYAELKLR